MGVPAVVSPGAKVRSQWANDVVSQIVPSAWTAVTFSGTWVNFGAPYQTAQIRKVADVVEVRGLIKSGAVGPIFTLPVDFRPPADFQQATQSASLFAMLQVVAATGVFSLSTGSTGSLSINCSFSTI